MNREPGIVPTDEDFRDALETLKKDPDAVVKVGCMTISTPRDPRDTCMYGSPDYDCGVEAIYCRSHAYKLVHDANHFNQQSYLDEIWELKKLVARITATNELPLPMADMETVDRIQKEVKDAHP